MNEIVKKLDSSKIQSQNLLLEAPRKEVTHEVLELKTKFAKYGINNSTYKYVSKKVNDIHAKNLREKEKVNKENAKITFFNLLTSSFLGYKVIDYKTLHEVCSDYNLYIGALSWYEKAIPEEVLPSLDSFTSTLRDNADLFKNRVKFQKNYSPTYMAGDTYKYELIAPFQNTTITTERMFKIAAPKSHFDTDNYNHIIGNELVKIQKPRIVGKVKFNVPKFEPKDPIIFVPFLFLHKVYCIIVDAWDKEGDDSRIRNMI